MSAWDKLLRALTPQSGAAIDGDHQLSSSLVTLLSGEDQTVNCLKVEQRYSYAYINSAATTVVKGSAGFLHRITVTGGTAGTIIVYDNPSTSGTIIASFDSTNMQSSYELNVIATLGITIITGAATKITVSYR